MTPLLWIGAAFWLVLSWPPTNDLFRAAHANIQAGRDPSATASAMLADKDVAISAARNIALDAADTTEAINFGGPTNGISFGASASSNKGNSDGSSTTQVNTQVTAGNTVNIDSGGNTTLRDAVVSANTVNANVGGTLVIEGLQDTSEFTEKQRSAGVGVTVCLPPICAGASSITGSAVKSDINSNYQSVTEQSAIRAGDGGFNVNVKGGTTLAGGAITSSQKAGCSGFDQTR